MNWIVQQIDEFTLWMLNTHRSRMSRLRQDQDRRERNRRIADRNQVQHTRKVARRMRVADAQQRQDTHDVLAGLRDVRDHMSSQRRRG